MCLSIDCNHGLTRRGALKAAAQFTALAGLYSTIPPAALLGRASAKEMEAGKPKPNAIGADAALGHLLKGNVRHVANRLRRRDFSAGRVKRVRAQFPIAAILSCADSRVTPEFVFDQGPGDIFVVRLAGNFVDDDGLASLEYAVKLLGTPLVMVLGHSNCGAVASAINVVEDKAELPGHLPGLVEAIKPAVEAAQAKLPKDLLAAAIKENVALNTKRLETAQPVLSDFVQRQQVKVVGGVYDLATGKVSLLS
ncbi:MAG TPA: carbonic anhydrase [Methylocella sp.]|nr:carbonic anhydrase [Methylocella sp.]